MVFTLGGHEHSNRDVSRPHCETATIFSNHISLIVLGKKPRWTVDVLHIFIFFLFSELDGISMYFCGTVGWQSREGLSPRGANLLQKRQK